MSTKATATASAAWLRSTNGSKPGGPTMDAENATIGYMCKTDFDWELGNASGGTGVFSSVEDLKKIRRCVESCGIVEVAVMLVRVVHEGAYDDDGR